MTNQKNWTDEAIITGFQGSEAERHAALRALFLQPGLREKALKMVAARGGTADDGRDVFQDAIVVADRKLRAGEFRSEAALSTWILGIVKWLWWAQQQKKHRRDGFEIPETPVGFDPENESPEHILLSAERKEALDKALDGVGDSCKKLLKMAALQIPMREIAVEMGLKNEENARVRAYDCREKLRKLILKNPTLLELLKPKKG